MWPRTCAHLPLPALLRRARLCALWRFRGFRASYGISGQLTTQSSLPPSPPGRASTPKTANSSETPPKAQAQGRAVRVSVWFGYGLAACPCARTTVRARPGTVSALRSRLGWRRRPPRGRGSTVLRPRARWRRPLRGRGCDVFVLIISRGRVASCARVPKPSRQPSRGATRGEAKDRASSSGCPRRARPTADAIALLMLSPTGRDT